MSDPMTRTDIEDVLSSIRRLVSEEARPDLALRAASASAPPEGAPAAAPGGGRLVLTPALRVAGREEPPAAPETAPEKAAAPAPVSEPAATPAEAAEWLPEAAVPEDSVSEDLPPEDLAPEDTTPEDTAPGDMASEEMAPESLLLQSARPATWEAADASDPGSDRIGAKIAGLEAAVAARSEQWDPEGTEEFDVDDNHSDAFEGPVRFFHRGAGHRDAAIEDGETVDGETVDGETAEVAPVPVSTAGDAALSGPAAFHSSRTPRAPEPAAGPAPEHTPRADKADPEVAPAPDTASADVWPEDQAAAAPQDKTAQEETAPPETDGPTAAGDGLLEEADSAFLDEEALRDVVREIIRQELQGTLGERITRNVRKLVRAEINRALASRDFE